MRQMPKFLPKFLKHPCGLEFQVNPIELFLNVMENSNDVQSDKELCELMNKLVTKLNYLTS